MIQHCLPHGSLISAEDTAAHAFPVGQALTLYIWVPATNTGTVKISDTAGITGGNLVGGITLPAGLTPFPIWPLKEMDDLAYQFSANTDSFTILVLR